MSLGKSFFTPWRLSDEGGTDPLMRGFFAVPAKKKMPQQNLNDQLIDHLFSSAHAVSLDLAAMNIQRGRDHGIPGYTEWRAVCNMSKVETFDDLKNEISDDEVRKKLENLYGHPGTIKYPLRSPTAITSAVSMYCFFQVILTYGWVEFSKIRCPEVKSVRYSNVC